MVGHYTGAGSEQTIELGFSPVAVYFGIYKSEYDGTASGGPQLLLRDLPNKVVEFTDTGLKLLRQGATADTTPSVNRPNTFYTYVAFR